MKANPHIYAPLGCYFYVIFRIFLEDIPTEQTQIQ